MSGIVLVGMSCKTSSVEVRERFAFRREDLPAALELLLAEEGVLEGVILSTCNRVEVYTVTEDRSAEPLASFLRKYHAWGGSVEPYLYVKTGAEAAGHLAGVAAGLDSMVLGEPEVFGQVKDAYRTALDRGAVGDTFRLLFPQVFSLVKKVRARSGIGQTSLSVSYVAVSLAREVFGSLAGKRLMVVGAGRMAEQTVRNLMEEGAKEVFVSNRTFQKAVSLAEQIRGTPVMLYEMPEYAASADIVISAASGTDFVLSYARMRHVLNGRKEPIFLIDIAVPRSIDPEIRELEGVHLYNIDDLEQVAAANAVQREAEAVAARSMIAARVPEIMAKAVGQEIQQAFRGIRTEAEEIRRQRFDRIITKLNVSEEERELIDSLTKSIVSTVLHCTMTKLQQQSANRR